MSAIAFFHAHPDDEAIFTGGTIARLTADGHRAVVVIATDGALGAAAGSEADGLAAMREEETRRSCAVLGVQRVVFLGYADSGALAESAHPLALARADHDEAARRLAGVLADEGVDSLVVYDEGGIYGHADHVAVHRIGRQAAAIAGIATIYEATVDREYLHFVETHLVDLAALSTAAPAATGVPTVLVTTTLDVGAWIEQKRTAMAAHASQIPGDAPVLALPRETFTAVYGFEWYVRSGPPGVLDDLSM